MEALLNTVNFDAIIIGVSLVALVLYRLYKGAAGANATKTGVEASIGPISWDTNGRMDFDSFFKIMQLSFTHGKSRFAKKRKELVAKRRRLLKDNDMKKYEQYVLLIDKVEQNHISAVLMQEICLQHKISDSELQQSLWHHTQDHDKANKIDKAA